MALTKAERAALREAFLRAPLEDLPLELPEAAALVGWLPSRLYMSNVPRARIDKRITFLRSQLVRFMKAHEREARGDRDESVDDDTREAVSLALVNSAARGRRGTRRSWPRMAQVDRVRDVTFRT
jgi:hypothetical protein